MLTALIIPLLFVPIRADILDGSGASLPVPLSTSQWTSIGYSSSVNPGYYFTGYFDSRGPVEWRGTFSGIGAYPCCGNTGTSDWSFAGLTGGYLYTGTYFRVAGLDRGESISLRAYDVRNQLILSPWLDFPVHVTANSANPNAISQANMPGWTFAAGRYTFTAATNAVSDQTINFPSNRHLYGLSVEKTSPTYAFGLGTPLTAPPPPSPVPEPATYGMILAAFAAIAFSRCGRGA